MWFGTSYSDLACMNGPEFLTCVRTLTRQPSPSKSRQLTVGPRRKSLKITWAHFLLNPPCPCTNQRPPSPSLPQWTSQLEQFLLQKLNPDHKSFPKQHPTLSPLPCAPTLPIRALSIGTTGCLISSSFFLCLYFSSPCFHPLTRNLKLVAC